MSERETGRRQVAEDELRALVDERVRAVAAKDPTPLAAREAPDVITFDVLPPLRSRGNEAVQSRTQAWFDGYRTAIGYQVHELEVRADGDVGFCSFLYHVSGTTVDDSEVSMWVRATLGCVRTEGRWLIVHDHESVPWDPETGQGVIGVGPE